MADNQPKTDLVNLANLKLSGATSIAAAVVGAIDDSVFASPTTATDTTTQLACLRYPYALKKALIDIQPKFARKYADLGTEIKITQNGAGGIVFPQADWELIFELPSDFLDLMAQVGEDDKSEKYDAEVRTVHSWAHIVAGTDGQAWYCKTAHTAASEYKPITGASYTDKWALFNTDDAYGADWETAKAYYTTQSSKLLFSYDYSNLDGDSAFIEYIAYAAAGVGDIPTYYDEDFIEAFTTLLASEMAAYTKEFNARLALRQEYERLAKPQAEASQSRPDYEEDETTWKEARTA